MLNQSTCYHDIFSSHHATVALHERTIHRQFYCCYHYDNWRLVTAEDIATFSFKSVSHLSTVEQISVHQSNLNTFDVGLDFLVTPSSRMITWEESVPGELGTPSLSEFTIHMFRIINQTCCSSLADLIIMLHPVKLFRRVLSYRVGDKLVIRSRRCIIF